MDKKCPNLFGFIEQKHVHFRFLSDSARILIQDRTQFVLAKWSQSSPAETYMKHQLVNLALFVRLEARPGKEEAVAQFLTFLWGLAEDESPTVTWCALQFSPNSFGIFAAFPDEAGRQEHLTGKVAQALMGRAPELFVKTPEIEKLEVLEAKLPL
jgi:quinol monooxygenase YgiN